MNHVNDWSVELNEVRCAPLTSQMLSLAHVQEAPRSVTETRNVSDVTSVCIGFVTTVFFQFAKVLSVPRTCVAFSLTPDTAGTSNRNPGVTSAWTVKLLRRPSWCAVRG